MKTAVQFALKRLEVFQSRVAIMLFDCDYRTHSVDMLKIEDTVNLNKMC